MSQIDRERALNRIKKCLALGQSANEHEAEAALRQAQVLMQRYQIDENDPALLGVTETVGRSMGNQRPAQWEVNLAASVARIYGCEWMYRMVPKWVRKEIPGEFGWVFVGVDPAPEIAQYAMAVMLRQCQRARRDYMATELKRVRHAANKTARADQYCRGWVYAATKAVQQFAGQSQMSDQVAEYMRLNHPKLTTRDALDRSENRASQAKALDDFVNGAQDGKSACISAGVKADQQAALEMQA
jgi:hypothetical protein